MASGSAGMLLGMYGVSHEYLIILRSGVVQQLLGQRIYGALCWVFDYVVNQRNPLMQACFVAVCPSVSMA